ncbi:MAG: YihY/virulence factor BrkB family protein, partial [Armatimonadota bacterium]
FAVTAGLEALRSANLSLLGIAPAKWPWIWSLSGYLVPLAGTVLAFTLMYKFLPYTRVPLRSAFFGGLFAGLLWEAAKIAFSFYLSGYASYGKIYGSLTGVVVLMIWINFSAVVAILGAEAGSIWARKHGAHV